MSYGVKESPLGGGFELVKRADGSAVARSGKLVLEFPSAESLLQFQRRLASFIDTLGPVDGWPSPIGKLVLIGCLSESGAEARTEQKGGAA